MTRASSSDRIPTKITLASLGFAGRHGPGNPDRRTGRQRGFGQGGFGPVPLSGTAPTIDARDSIIRWMARYAFKIRQGTHLSDVPIDLPDDDAAWDEAAMACCDMIRDTVEQLRDAEWRLEVVDESGAVRHLFRLTAESFDQ